MCTRCVTLNPPYIHRVRRHTRKQPPRARVARAAIFNCRIRIGKLCLTEGHAAGVGHGGGGEGGLRGGRGEGIIPTRRGRHAAAYTCASTIQWTFNCTMTSLQVRLNARAFFYREVQVAQEGKHRTAVKTFDAPNKEEARSTKRKRRRAAAT